MISLFLRYTLNVFYYVGGFLTFGILYFIVYNIGALISRTMQATGLSQGPKRRFKSPAAIRADMSLIIDWLYKLADYSDVVLKTGITLINTFWFKEIMRDVS